MKAWEVPTSLNKKAMIEYLVIYEKTKTGYSAYVPDIPGVIATGKTKRIVEKNIFGAIQFHLKSYPDVNKNRSY